MTALFADARRTDIAQVAKQLGARLKRQGVEWVGPCPRCGGTDRFGVNIRKQVFNCRSCGGGDVIDLVVLVTGGTKAQAAAHITRQRIIPRVPTSEGVGPPTPSDEHTGKALAVWHEAGDPRNIPVDTYLLRHRRLHLPEEATGEAIRYHPLCPFGRKRTPSMVCLVRNIVTNKPQAIYRTALSIDGHKVKIDGNDRLSLGPIAGGAIKLSPDENVTTCLGIGEGVETTLSMQNIPEFGLSPVWSVLSAGGIASFPVLPGVECLWIAVDHDASGAGQRAARACADRWRAAGREVFLVKPIAVKADLNDLFAGVRDA